MPSKRGLLRQYRRVYLIVCSEKKRVLLGTSGAAFRGDFHYYIKINYRTTLLYKVGYALEGCFIILTFPQPLASR